MKIPTLEPADDDAVVADDRPFLDTLDDLKL
jgi:hypothetical protein